VTHDVRASLRRTVYLRDDRTDSNFVRGSDLVPDMRPLRIPHDRGRHYVAGAPLQTIREDQRASLKPLVDPYPTLIAEIRRAHSGEVLALEIYSSSTLSRPTRRRRQQWMGVCCGWPCGDERHARMRAQEQTRTAGRETITM